MGSHGGRCHQDGATLRAKLALEIPAVPLEVLALDGSLLYLFKSRGSGDAAGAVARVPGRLRASSSKGDPMFKERPMSLKTLALIMAVKKDLQGSGSSPSSPPPLW